MLTDLGGASPQMEALTRHSLDLHPIIRTMENRRNGPQIATGTARQHPGQGGWIKARLFGDCSMSFTLLHSIPDSVV